MGSKSKRAHTDRLAWIRSEGNRMARRMAFLSAFNANPCNFLSGSVLSNFYRYEKNQQALEGAAANWIESRNARMSAIGGPMIPWERAA